MRTFLSVSTSLIVLPIIFYFAQSQSSCSEFTDETACNFNSNGACQWLTNALTGMDGECQCKSEVKLDILFALDASGSIGLSGFQILKQFINNLVVQGINTHDSKIGFTIFSTRVNFSRSIQMWNTSELQQYVGDIRWMGSYTNTPQVIQESLWEFQGIRAGSTYTPDPDRQQVLIMVTDGNPCLPESLGGCPQSVCQYKSQITVVGVRVIIIGVGDGLTPQYVQCLCQTQDDFIPVASFSTADFNSIVGSLSGVLCPVSKDFKVTEVKSMKKPASWTSAGDGRFSRFVELYNDGIPFNLQDIDISGLINMPSGGPDVNVSQGSYVVFYDANDAIYPSVVSCHLCGSDCDLSDCSFAGVPNTGYCWCGNSIYVACGNSNDGDLCRSDSVPSLSSGTAHDGCHLCTFDDAMNRSDWSIRFTDGASGALIDEVVYDGATWIETDDKYSYELFHKGMNNDDGNNWMQSCNPLGTPGADPAASCDAICVSGGCGTGSNSCLSTGQCDCDTDSGYYPQCTSPTSCTKCALVPQVGDCVVYWTKNGSHLLATYTWDLAERDASTRYVLSTYAGSLSGDIKIVGQRGSDSVDDCASCIWEPIFPTTDFWTGNTSFGGYVQVAIDQCVSNENGEETCDIYLGQKTMCSVRTAPPTTSTTTTTTAPPETSLSTTPEPAHVCPVYHWSGGSQHAICAENDRCNCYNTTDECCLLNPIFEENTYDRHRSHRGAFGCKLDVEKLYPREQNESAAGSNPGYLLTPNQQHYFQIAIAPKDYSCTMDIFWQFEWLYTDCNYDADEDRRRLIENCNDSSTSLEQMGLDIDVTSGWLKVWGAHDEQNATVKFHVQQLLCDDGSCSNRAIYGKLVIVNASSQCSPQCFDGRIYPMEIPVWYNNYDIFVAVPSRERALPWWMWWLIAAMSIFLCCIALLLYKYWWKTQVSAATLKATQKDLDIAINEEENGLGDGLGADQVTFNALATSAPGTAHLVNGAPNKPPDDSAGIREFVIPTIERPVYQTEYAPTMGTIN